VVAVKPARQATTKKLQVGPIPFSSCLKKQDRQPRHQPWIMKHHGAAPLDPDVSFDFFVERAEHAQEGALSRTAAAQERHELAGPQFERQIRQDGRASKRLFNVETITAESARAARSESASIASECPPPDLPSWHSRGTVHTNGELLTIGRDPSQLLVTQAAICLAAPNQPAARCARDIL